MTAYRSLEFVACDRSVRGVAAPDRDSGRDPPGNPRRPALRLDPIVLAGDEGLSSAPIGTLSSAGADPAALSLSAERDAGLRRAVESLAEPYREVVALRFFGDLSLAEIATATDRPVATVKTHLRRGLLQLAGRSPPTWDWTSDRTVPP